MRIYLQDRELPAARKRLEHWDGYGIVASKDNRDRILLEDLTDGFSDSLPISDGVIFVENEIAAIDRFDSLRQNHAAGVKIMMSDVGGEGTHTFSYALRPVCTVRADRLVWCCTGCSDNRDLGIKQ